MKLTVYGANLEKKAILYHWISLLWKPKYNGYGTFCAEFQSAPDMLGVIVRGDYIHLDIDETIMMVTSISFDTGKFTVSGFSAEYILAARVSDTVITSQNAEEAMRSLVSGMSTWPLLELGESSGLTDSFTGTISDGSILKYCQAIGEAADIGFRIRIGRNAEKQRRLFFTCYRRGTEPSAKFSAVLGNMGGEKYTESENNYYNVAVVAGAGTGDERVTVTVGDLESSGTDRREIYLDARSVQKEDGETDAEYLARLEQYGREKLADMKLAQLSEFTVSDDSIMLGDMVYIIPSYIGEPFTARITSVSIKIQNNKITKTIGVGTPLVTRKAG